MDKQKIKILGCPESYGDILTLDPNSKIVQKKGQIESGTLLCRSSGETFPIEKGVPNLLPTRIRKNLAGETALEGLNRFDQEIVKGIKWSGEMVPETYYVNVADPRTSVPGARNYERYEDLILDKLIDEYVKSERKLIFVEMGSGTGRYLIRYSARISNEKPWRRHRVCRPYRSRKELKRYYLYDKDYAKNLQLIVGIEFQETMVKLTLDLLRKMGLGYLLGKRIIPIIGAGQYLNLKFDQMDEYKYSNKLVTCMFQTLGNQSLRELQVKLIKTMKSIAMPNGKIVISVFNKRKFWDWGLPVFYKQQVEPTVGEINEKDPKVKEMQKKGILLTKKGVYSEWFYKEDLKALLDDAELKAEVYDNTDLVKKFDFTEHRDYLPYDTETEVTSRAIIAVADLRYH
jgi:uncharacterized protein YbaR (Trm112 family)/SAM-dependent methyltransferase